MAEAIDKLFKSLSSLKMTLAILFGLVLASIPGTLVDPQKSTYDFYHSWWFTSLLFLLTLNLIACTFYRKQIRASVLMIHSSIFFIFLGGIVGSRFGFRGTLNLQDGETSSVAHQERSLRRIVLPFQVRSDGFRLRYYEGSDRPSEYESDLTILEGEKDPVRRKTIRVNDPLRYQGISFYQANYGEVPKGFVLRIKDQTTGKMVEEKRIGFETPVGVKRQGLSFRVVDYSPNYEGFGPAALVRVERTKGPPEQWILFKRHPNFEARRRGRYLPVLADVETAFYTGLQVVKDPGVPLVWIGCTLMVLGLFLGFMSPKWRRLDLLVRQPKPAAGADMALAAGAES